MGDWFSVLGAGDHLYGSLTRVAVCAYAAIYGCLVLCMMKGWHVKLLRLVRATILVRPVVYVLYSMVFVIAASLLALPFLYWQQAIYTRPDTGRWFAGALIGCAAVGGIVLAGILIVYALQYRARRLWWLWSALVLCAGMEAVGAAGGMRGDNTGPMSRALLTPELQAKAMSILGKAGLNLDDVRVAPDIGPLKGNGYSMAPWKGRPRVFLTASAVSGILTANELLFVIAHEVGHIVHHHRWKMLTAVWAQMLLAFWLVHLTASYLIRKAGNRLRLRHLYDIETLPLLFGLFSFFTMVTASLPNSCSRLLELQADAFAMRSTGDIDGAESYFARVASQAGMEYEPGQMLTVFLENHPTMADRVALAEKIRVRAAGHQPPAL